VLHSRHFKFFFKFATILCVKISAVLITFNEEKHIADAIKSLACADEILVVDSESTDGTREKGMKAGAKVLVKKWAGFSAQKQFAVDQAEHDWIISLDADERVSPELRSEIFGLKKNGTTADGYRIPRLSIYMGRPIRHGGWYPDWQLRFFDRRKGKWKDVRIHESFEMAKGSKTAKLNGEIIHYSVESAAHHHLMVGERYAPLAARQMFDNGRRTSPIKIVFAGWLTFIQTYIVKGGFLDGIPGFVIAYFAAHHSFLKHVLLWEMQNAKTPPE